MTYKKIQLLCVLLYFCIVTGCSDAVRLESPRLEMQETPLGVSVPHPVFSWHLASDRKGVEQNAYEIRVSHTLEGLDSESSLVWNSGKVASDAMQAAYDGQALEQGTDYYWKVRAYTNEGTTSWSKAHRFSTAISADRWQAEWIGEDRLSNPGENRDSLYTRLAARYLRKEFAGGQKDIRRAMLYISGLGAYEAYLNGERVSDDFLAPALTFYSKLVYYNTYDVTRLLHKGDNTLGVVLGNGRYFWLRAQGKPIAGFGLPRLLARLEVEYEDGSRQAVVTDGSWKVTSKGPIIANNEYDGEEYDARKELPGWNRSGYDDTGWQPADVVSAPAGQLCAQPCPPIRVMERVRPVSITRMPSGKYLVDMGQNMVGRLNATFTARKDSVVAMRFSELLNPDSTLYVANLRSAKATDLFTAATDGKYTWKPAFVFHGFRYIELDGLTEMPAAKDLEVEVLYDEMATIGTFETDNRVINQVYSNAYWGIRGNYRNMPTDCPQRDERHGWMGDRTTGCWGESFIFENCLLYRKWLQDIECSQGDNGCISVVSPQYWYERADDITWSGAYIFAAEMMYRHFGDKSGIVKHYPSMKRWAELIIRQYVQDGLVIRDCFGDWCLPPESLELIFSKDPTRKPDGRILSTATFWHILHLLADFASQAGHPEDADGYLACASSLKEGLNRHLFNYETAQYGNNAVTGNLLPLYYGLVPEGYEQRVLNSIVEKTEVERAGHVSTGVVGIQYLMRCLTKYGRQDLAYKLATQETYPSWGYMAKRGATTIWELWNGDTAAPDMNSANHVMLLGDLVIWYYENLAGIKNAEGSTGFRHIEMKPCFPNGLGRVSATHRSVSGTIGSRWERDGDSLSWTVTIPANCSATLYLPVALHPEKPVLAEGIRGITSQETYWQVELSSGTYHFGK